MTAPEAELRTAWCRVAGVAPMSRAAAALDALLARLREPHRRYHTQVHVMWVLRHITTLATTPAADGVDLAAVRWAALYHDAVYDPRAGDNEAASADLAAADAAALGRPAAWCSTVRRLVLATAAHEPAAPDEALLVDADLAILGADAGDYQAYVHGVRAEYAHVDDDAWRTGRARVLRLLLAHEPLFHTAPMRAEREARARANMAAELAALEAA